jgi:ATP-dependent RNA helicase DeaD
VGAIANEGGLSRRDFGRIDIRGDYSLVELPADLGPETWAALARTRISGQRIHLARDDGPPAHRARARGDDRPASRTSRPRVAGEGKPKARWKKS